MSKPMDIPDKFYRVSAKALVFNDEGKVLLLKEPGDKGWELPGGGIEYGEDPITTIHRELVEEAGCIVDTIEPKPLLVWSQQTTTRTMGDIWILLLCYRVTLKEMTFVPSDEAEDYGFFSPEDMGSIKLHQNISKLPAHLRALRVVSHSG